MKKILYSFISLSFLLIIGCGDAENGTDGTNGINTAIEVTPYSGSDCPNGGIEISYGLDDNSDGALSSLEVDGSSVVCNGGDGTDGTDGTDGDDGTDGGGNVVILLVMLSGGEFGFVDEDGDGKGYLGVTVTNSDITYDVASEGTVTVEKLFNNQYMSLPLNTYLGETTDLQPVEGNFQYTTGSVDVIWSTTYDFSVNQWNAIADLWSGTYKIRITSP